MIITPHAAPVVVGPAWPCCYQEPTEHPWDNPYNGYQNVSIEDVKSRFYNSVKKVELALSGVNFTVTSGDPTRIAEIATILTNFTMNLFGDKWFHADSSSSWDWSAENWKKISFTFAGAPREAIVHAWHQVNNAQHLYLEIYWLTDNMGAGQVAMVQLVKNFVQSPGNLTLADLSGSFVGDGQIPFAGPDVIGQIWYGFDAGATHAHLTLNGSCTLAFTGPTEADFDFNAPAMAFGTSDDQANPSRFDYGVDGQDAGEISARLQPFSATFNRTAPGVYYPDPVATGIPGFSVWPGTIFQKITPSIGGNPGGVLLGGSVFVWYRVLLIRSTPSTDMGEWFLLMGHGQELYLDVAFSTALRFASMQMQVYQHRGNQIRSGAAYMANLIPPNRDE